MVFGFVICFLKEMFVGWGIGEMWNEEIYSSFVTVRHRTMNNLIVEIVLF